MFEKLMQKIKNYTSQNHYKDTESFPPEQQINGKISENLNQNIVNLKEILGNSNDINIREFSIKLNTEINAFIIFIDGLVEESIINDNIMKPLMIDIHSAYTLRHSNKVDIFTQIKKNILTVSEIGETSELREIIDAILSGETVLLIDNCKFALRIDTHNLESRSIQESPSESAIRGSREGFIERLYTNTTLLRRKIKSTNLIFEFMKIGRVTKTDICIAYIRGISNEKLVDELRKRLNKIEIDGILESGYVEQYIEDDSFSIFPTIGHSEKPDIIAAKLLEGRIAVLIDGTPVVLTLPYLLIEALQSSDDYSSRHWYATFIRWIRIVSLLIVLYLPGFYIAAQTYHHEMLPTHIFITMAASKEGVPFPAFVEILLMSIIFEVLKEAGVRMPRPIGQAVSIVGALVLGEAAVEAGLVSNPAVMITALAGIAGFVVYTLNEPITILRFAFTILGALGGLFTILIGTIFVLVHLASLRSFGVPYLSPIAPRTTSDLKDVLIKLPIWMMRRRPRVIGGKNINRLNSNKMSQSSNKEEKDGK